MLSQRVGLQGDSSKKLQQAEKGLLDDVFWTVRCAELANQMPKGIEKIGKLIQRQQQAKSNQPTSRGRRNSIAISPNDQLISVKQGATTSSPDVNTESGVPKDAADCFASAEAAITKGDPAAAIKAYEQGSRICMCQVASLSMETLRGMPGAQQQKKAMKVTLDTYVGKMQRAPMDAAAASMGVVREDEEGVEEEEEEEQGEPVDQVLLDLLAAERLDAYLPGLQELEVTTLVQLTAASTSDLKGAGIKSGAAKRLLKLAKSSKERVAKKEAAAAAAEPAVEAVPMSAAVTALLIKEDLQNHAAALQKSGLGQVAELKRAELSDLKKLG